ncbi:MAG: LysM peptidoglycan-binding domain-containing protein [Anaerolineae bacterium]|nr:LysM peptidoglycan-binding domain-containing protein [Anaerolineae bacterium]
MFIRWALILILIFALTGCFQEAGESLQSTSSTLEPTSDSIEQMQPTQQDTSAFDATAETIPGDSMDSGEPTSIPLTIIAQPTDTPNLPQPDTPTTIPGNGDATPAQFITPVSPLIPTTEAGTPLPVLQTTATPGGLITPTAFLTSGDGGSENPECVYVVQPGDNLYRIAINNSTTVEQMKNANPSLAGANPILQIGQRLQLPNCGSGQEAVSAPDETVNATPTQLPVPGDGSGGQSYTVQPGDTLYIIAQRFGTTVQAIQNANQLPNPDRLDVGQVLTIP